jgi:hypothetical protein
VGFLQRAGARMWQMASALVEHYRVIVHDHLRSTTRRMTHAHYR